jgi:hypothetical protein
MAAPSPSPAPPATAWRFAETSRRDECTGRCRAWGCHTYHIIRIEWHPENSIRSHPQAALEDATRISSILSGGPAPPATAWRFPLRRSTSGYTAWRFAETSRRDECTSRCRAWGCHTYLLSPIGWRPQSAPVFSCRRQWRQPSLAGERGRIGDGFFHG